MNAFLRFSIVAITIAASSVHAGTVGTFIPAEPSIESPSNSAVAVSQTPRFESSLPEAQLNGSDIGVNVSQTQTDWLLYTPDEDITFFGGAESSTEPGIIASGSTKTVRLPYSISVHDDEISIMTVSQAGDITFRNDEGIILAEMAARIDKSYYTESSNSHSLAVIKITPMLIIVQWYHKSIDGAPTAWQSDVQAYITRLGTFGLRLSEHDVNNAMFNLTTGEVGCHLRNSDSTFEGRFEPLSFWKTSAIVSNNKFSLVCVSQDILNHSVTVTSFEDPAPVFFDLPEFTVLSSSEIDYQLTNDQKLEANTLYALQAKHYVKETSDVSASPIINTSAFGEAISFTTEAAEISIPETVPNDDSSTAEGSSGGSGGGSLLWIFAALPLLRRRGA